MSKNQNDEQLKELFDRLANLEALGEADFVPLIGEEESEAFKSIPVPEELPVLPVRNNVLFPGTVLPITLNREKSIRLVQENYKEKNPIGIFAQKNKDAEDPKGSDIHLVGTMAHIIKTLKMPDGTMMVLIHGLRRVKLAGVVTENPYTRAHVLAYDDNNPGVERSGVRALYASVRDQFIKHIKISGKIPEDALVAVQNIESPDYMMYFVASMLEIDAEEKQRILEKRRLEDRAYVLIRMLNQVMKVLELRKQIARKVEADLTKQQKEYFLTQQLRTIQEELGEGGVDRELEEIEERAKKKKWKEEIKAHFEKEVAKARRTHYSSPDFSVQVNYLNTLLDLPWDEYSQDNYDLDKAREILNRDHYGLEKVKERILSYIAVLHLRGDMKAPILCLVGPPGVGKTSLGKSIAAALGRSYIRMSLGGLHDEAEIRGHRKTYIGAMPGRVIQNMRKAKNSNPVFLLDEIDKISGMSPQGDPSAALLELLDPEQNKAFHDNYLEVDYDLSRVLFIATANTTASVHPALLDRMEVIEVPSYVLEEKRQIARRHLLPKQLEEHGMKAGDLNLTDPMLDYLIGRYTREAGVRMLEKDLAGIVRERAKCMTSSNAQTRKKGLKPDKAFLKEALGTPPHGESAILEEDKIGVVTGLAWTEAGGDVLFIEAALGKGKGEISVTGNIGKIMQESITLAYSYIKANAKKLGISQSQINNSGVFLHVPEGAIPKDGPSAGIAVFTALLSAYTGRPVKRTVAMTGEITLRGKVTPIGGLREKMLAAKRAGITDVVLCRQNKPQAEEIPAMYTKGIRIHYIDRVEEVVRYALI